MTAALIALLAVQFVALAATIWCARETRRYARQAEAAAWRAEKALHAALGAPTRHDETDEFRAVNDRSLIKVAMTVLTKLLVASKTPVCFVRFARI